MELRNLKTVLALYDLALGQLVCFTVIAQRNEILGLTKGNRQRERAREREVEGKMEVKQGDD